MDNESAIATRDVEPTAVARIDPQEHVAYYTEVANALNGVILEKELFNTINGRKHVQAEGWETVISLDGAVPIIEWVRPITEKGEVIAYEARAIIQKNGETVAAGEMECGMDEFPTRGQKGRAKHRAAKSAAQTWAVAKAARTKYAWIVALAGYSGTPAEEVRGADAVEPNQRAAQTPAEMMDDPNWCAEHGELFFKRGKMRGFAHKVGSGWHNKPEDAPEPSQERRTATQGPKEGDSPSPEQAGELHVESGTIRPDTQGDMLSASGNPTDADYTAFWAWTAEAVSGTLKDRQEAVHKALDGGLVVYIREGHTLQEAQDVCARRWSN